MYAATKNAVRTISEGLRQEAGPNVRVTAVSPGFARTDFTESVPNDELRSQMRVAKEQIAIPPEAISEAIAFAIGQPSTVDVGDIVVRPTAQS